MEVAQPVPDEYSCHEVAMIDRINQLDKKLSDEIGEMKGDVKGINIKIDQILEQNKEYKGKVDELQHDMIKVKQWCLAIAVVAGGGASALKSYIMP
jgi:hypothetical protein